MGCKEKRERLDKAVSAQTAYSRREVRHLISKGQVLVNSAPARDPGMQIDPDMDEVTVAGKPLHLSRYCYLMLNKPRGVVCATQDAALPTVLDLVPEDLRRSGLFPAGRLDKETEGFVLITNDGALAHRLLAPKSHVPKTYLALLDKPFDGQTVQAFAQGLELLPERPREKNGGGSKPLKCMPVQLEADGGDFTRARVILRQGMYHQVRRMFAACGLHVTALYREKIGGLALDPALKPGDCRLLTDEEAALLSLRSEL